MTNSGSREFSYEDRGPQQRTHWTCGECGAHVAEYEEHVCGVSVAEVLALKAWVEDGASRRHSLGIYSKTVLLLCDQFLARKGAD